MMEDSTTREEYSSRTVAWERERPRGIVRPRGPVRPVTLNDLAEPAASDPQAVVVDGVDGALSSAP